jgi:hypothetical protein
MTTPYDEGHDNRWEITEQPPEPGPAWNVFIGCTVAKTLNPNSLPEAE